MIYNINIYMYRHIVFKSIFNLRIFFLFIYKYIGMLNFFFKKNLLYYDIRFKFQFFF